jgi:hypothetical protein
MTIDTDVDLYEGNPVRLPWVCTEAAKKAFEGEQYGNVFHIIDIEWK